MNQPHLVISLDFELLWGVFDKINPAEKLKYFKNTREVIPEILKLFTSYNIRCAWATVGMLFNKDAEAWLANQPETLPNYENQELSAYRFFKENKKELDGLFCFAHELINEIKESEGQEIGTHTYSHYYCLENGQNLTSFKADLKMAVKLAKEAEIDLKSLVFPRNQFNLEYLKACKELGITSVRSNPPNWYWKNTQKDTLQQKIFRTADAYMGQKDKSYALESIDSSNPDLPLQQPASRLLRPHANNFLDGLKLKRIKAEMIHAAQNNLVYHLWWHPHNFGNSPVQSLRELEEILKCFAKCQSKYRMQSSSMLDITNTFTSI